MFSKLKSCGLHGINGYMVEVETDISNGIPVFEIVGLGDAAIKESKERVRAAIKNAGLEFPLRRITLNLAPANMRKEGSSFDLAIALGILAASGQINSPVINKYMFLGELSLDAEVKPVRGVLPMALCAMDSGVEYLVVPEGNALEASIVKGIKIISLKNLADIVLHLNGEKNVEDFKNEGIDTLWDKTSYDADFSDVKGHESVKRALEVAASGSHNCLLVGPPGCGKTMLAKRMPSILPQMTFEEAIEVTKIHSTAGLLPAGTALIAKRPFRSPHHTITEIGLTGGGGVPKPGEISLAHYGVLFLDELPEFSRKSLEALRQPIEDGIITISRINATLTYPANVTLICAANPCKCGKLLDLPGLCTCTPKQIQQYTGKLNGPLMDRIDLQVEVSPLKYKELENVKSNESSAVIRNRVNRTRKVQLERYKGMKIYSNSQLQTNMLEKFCLLDEKCRDILRKSFERLGLSARAYSRILKVSRTIADMDQSEAIKPVHIAEAIQYRRFDRNIWSV